MGACERGLSPRWRTNQLWILGSQASQSGSRGFDFRNGRALHSPPSVEMQNSHTRSAECGRSCVQSCLSKTLLSSKELMKKSLHWLLLFGARLVVCSFRIWDQIRRLCFHKSWLGFNRDLPFYRGSSGGHFLNTIDAMAQQKEDGQAQVDPRENRSRTQISLVFTWIMVRFNNTLLNI